MAPKEQQGEMQPSILETYRKCIFREMYYLKENGGRRYKVVNGRRVGRTAEMYDYSFELEAELCVAEDSPMSLKLGSDVHTGIVVACENFEILLALADDIGPVVSTAFITVEPWKLLELMGNRLINAVPQSRIAKEILYNGPELSTCDPIAGVSKGQEAAIEHAMTNMVTVIWGPPGTGKTHTMAEMAIRFLAQGKSVACVSHSNVSVDGIALKIAELMEKRGLGARLERGEVMRFGHPRDERLIDDERLASYAYALSRKPKLKKRVEELNKEKSKIANQFGRTSKRRFEIERELKGIRSSVRQDESECVEKASVVATTVSKLYANKLFEDKLYDVVMFDEVSMAYVPQVLVAATFARERMVCVGDFRQLAPISQAPDVRRGLSRDLFWYLNICNERQDAFAHPWLVMLNEQRRMHPDIAAFPNATVYRSLLRNHESVFMSRQAIADGKPCSGESMVFLDLTGTYCTSMKNSDNSRFNILSAALSFSAAISAEKDNECPVGIIAPYNAQVRLVRAMIQDLRDRKVTTDVSCATVHQFQGSERDVIVFDLVESYPSKRLGLLTSDNDNGAVSRLVNVAVTRARGKLITIANRAFWENITGETKNAFTQLVKHHVAHDYTAGIRAGKLRGLIENMNFGPNISVMCDGEVANDKLIHDIERAVEKIVISIPDGNLLPEYEASIESALRKARRRRVDVMVKALDYKSLPENWKGYAWKSDDAACPLILIDDNILWYGMPLSRGRFTDGTKGVSTVLQIALKIRGKHTIEMIRSLTELESRTVDGNKSALQKKAGLAADKNSDEKGAGGFAKYVSDHIKCRKCGKPMKLAQGRTGKSFLRCSGCGETSLIDKNEVNHYLSISQAKCPKCKSYLHAAISKYGIYVACDARCGKTLKVDQI